MKNIEDFFFELLHCMDALDSLTFEEEIVGIVKEKINVARQTLLENRIKSGASGTINLMTEACPRSIKRTYHSKN